METQRVAAIGRLQANFCSVLLSKPLLSGGSSASFQPHGHKQTGKEGGEPSRTRQNGSNEEGEPLKAQSEAS